MQQTRKLKKVGFFYYRIDFYQSTFRFKNKKQTITKSHHPSLKFKNPFNLTTRFFKNSNLQVARIDLPVRVFGEGIQFLEPRLKYNFTAKFHDLLTYTVESRTGYKLTLAKPTNLLGLVKSNYQARVASWAQHLYSFRRLFPAPIFLTDFLVTTHLLFKIRDSEFFVNWLLKFFARINFFKFKSIVRFFRYIIVYLYSPLLPSYRIVGLKLCLKGKVGVVGNARTRTIRFMFGGQSVSNYTYKTSQSTQIIRTFTGAISLNFELYYY